MALSEVRIEDAVSVSPVTGDKADCFTNTYPLWLPPTARGTYGGTFISQSLSAAQATVPEDFTAYLIQSQFVRAGLPDAPLTYEVERISEGKNFAVRSIKVIQNGLVAFIALVSLTREPDSQRASIKHAEPMPSNVPRPPDYSPGDEFALDPTSTHHRGAYVTKKVGITESSSPTHDRRIHQWFKSRHPMSQPEDARIQQAALAYICDNYLVQAIPHTNKVFDFVSPPRSEADYGSRKLWDESPRHDPVPASDGPAAARNGTRHVGMMVSLSHTMYFHNVKDIQVHDWMLSEIGSYWSGHERGIATQKIWSANGTLLASCYQDGLVRLVKEQTWQSQVKSHL